MLFVSWKIWWYIYLQRSHWSVSLCYLSDNLYIAHYSPQKNYYAINVNPEHILPLDPVENQKTWINNKQKKILASDASLEHNQPIEQHDNI